MIAYLTGSIRQIPVRSALLLTGMITLNLWCLSAPAIAQAQTLTDYVPLEPCRIFDTRQTIEMLAGETRNFFAFEIEPGDIGGQGGKEGGCNIPTDAVAIQINFSAVTPSGNGFMRAWAFGDGEPTATLMNWSGKNISNGVATPVCPNICLFEMTIKAFASDTDLVGDVVGYYPPVSSLVKQLYLEERALKEPALGRP